MRLRSRSLAFFAFIFLWVAIGSTAACDGRPQGYWTRPDQSQAVINQEYSPDEAGCKALAQRETSQPHKARIFSRCMASKGYQWVTEAQGPYSLLADLQRSPLSSQYCSQERLTIDAFGNQKCVPRGDREGPQLKEPPHPTATPGPSSPGAIATTSEQKASPTDGRTKDDEHCRQYAKESMSGTYAVYSQCMRDKGWPPKP